MQKTSALLRALRASLSATALEPGALGFDRLLQIARGPQLPGNEPQGNKLTRADLQFPEPPIIRRDFRRFAAGGALFSGQ